MPYISRNIIIIMMIIICLFCFHSSYWNACLLHLFPTLNTFYTFIFLPALSSLAVPSFSVLSEGTWSQYYCLSCQAGTPAFVKQVWNGKNTLSHSCPLAVSLREIPFCLSISTWLTDCWADARLQTIPSGELGKWWGEICLFISSGGLIFWKHSSFFMTTWNHSNGELFSSGFLGGIGKWQRKPCSFL